MWQSNPIGRHHRRVDYFPQCFLRYVSGGVTTLTATTCRSFPDSWRVFIDSLRINVRPVWLFAGHNRAPLCRADPWFICGMTGSLCWPTGLSLTSSLVTQPLSVRITKLYRGNFGNNDISPYWFNCVLTDRWMQQGSNSQITSHLTYNIKPHFIYINGYL